MRKSSDVPTRQEAGRAAHDVHLRREVLATWVTLNATLESLSSVDLDRCLQLELASASPRPTVARRLLGRICRLAAQREVRGARSKAQCAGAPLSSRGQSSDLQVATCHLSSSERRRPPAKDLKWKTFNQVIGCGIL